MPIENPIKPDGHLQILYGNLAPEGSVAKITGKEGLEFEARLIQLLVQLPPQNSFSAASCTDFILAHPACLFVPVVSDWPRVGLQGPARCFDSEEDMLAALANDPPSFKGGGPIPTMQGRCK